MKQNKCQPSAGDIVVCTSGELIGKTALLSGKVNKSHESFEICFDARPFFDGESIACSGGMRFNITPDELIKTSCMTQATYEICHLGYNGFPSGETISKSVSIWEYHDKNGSVFKDTFTVEDIAERLHADYYIDTGNSKSPLSINFTKENDITGRAIFNAAKAFEALEWICIPSKCNSVKYIVSCGLTRIAELAGKAQLNQFIQSYKLEYQIIEKNRGYLLPNMNVETWAPAPWRKRSIQLE